MDARGRATAGRSYEDFQPSANWISEPGSETFVLSLPGFKKEHLRVQLDSNRNLRVSGERPLDSNRSRRFFKEVQIPDDCDVNGLSAKFEQGILQILLPKTIRWVGVTEQTTPTKESPPRQYTSKTQDSEKDSTDSHKKPTITTSEMEGSKGAVVATTDETKKEEEKKKDETKKTFEGSAEMEANGALLKESYMHGGGSLLLGLDESRQLVVNVVVGLLVLLALLVYILRKITS